MSNSSLQLKQHNNFFDVFTGLGWENHTRFLLKNKTLSFISGKTLTKAEFLQIKQEIKNNASSSSKK